VRTFLSILFWSFFAISCVALFLVALLIFVATLPFDRNRFLLHLFSCFWAQLYFYVNPLWKLEIEGRERLPWRGAAVLVSNHQSLGDILVLFGLYRPFKWVSKRSVFSVPFLGWNMKLNGYIGLVRGDRASITRMMIECENWLDRGVPILMFPEGTRSPDGELKAFKEGAFKLAITKQCPIYPIVVSGTAYTLPKHGVVLAETANCRVRVLPPVDPQPFGSNVEALREHVRNLMVAEKQRLELGHPQPVA
jgi:1-acyl-sn-glycerol-3-phosphate acyltransferase